MKRGSAGFEFRDEEYEATIAFANDGAYDGVDSIFSVERDRELGVNEGFAVWFALTESERDRLKEQAWDNAEPDDQEFENPLEVF